ncbi:MAG: histidine kinase dimerization/phosphoacceptor domain -containing protein [Balneolales bacterium]
MTEQKKLNILHLEDSAYDAEFIHRYLKKAALDFNVNVVDTKKGYQKALKKLKPDLIISDHSMPNFDSGQALELFNLEDLHIPFILVTGAVSEEFAVESLKKGADDYILKSNLARLPNAIKRSLEEKKIEKQRDELIVKLKASLAEKEVLLNEIHHRVKNNLAIITSLLNLQAGSAKDKKLKSLLKESESRVLSMSMIHEMLYQQDDFSKIAFGPYISKLWDHISNNYKTPGLHVDFKVEAKSIFLEIGTAVPCALIINELLTNSFKHAFKDREKGEISIIISKNENLLNLVVKDNGIGLPKYVDPSTLGLSLIHGLARQLDGTVSVRRNNGTEFTISIAQFNSPSQIDKSVDGLFNQPSKRN